MSYNGSGIFTANSTGLPVVTGTTISSVMFNAFTADVATGLTTCVTRDGQSPATANLPFGGFRLTGIGAATARTDAAQYAQIQNATSQVIGAIAGTNTITGTLTPTLTAYASGQSFSFIPANTNTGAATINIDSLGAKNIYLSDGALLGGELMAGVPVALEYDGTRFHITSNSATTVADVSGWSFMNAAQIADVRAGALSVDCYSAIAADISALNQAGVYSIKILDVPAGGYLLQTPLTLYSNIWMQGVGVWDAGTFGIATKIVGKHTGNAVTSLVGQNLCKIADCLITTDATTAPKTVLLLGRDSVGSAESHVFERSFYAGHPSVAVVYNVASEKNSFYDVQVINSNTGTSGAKYCWVMAQSDIYGVGGLTASSLTTQYIRSAFVQNLSKALDSACVRIDGGVSTGCIDFHGYLVASEGAFVEIKTGQIDGGDITLPITFDCGGETNFIAGVPQVVPVGYRLECAVRASQYIWNLTLKQTPSVSSTWEIDASNASLKNPNITSRAKTGAGFRFWRVLGGSLTLENGPVTVAENCLGVDITVDDVATNGYPVFAASRTGTQVIDMATGIRIISKPIFDSDDSASQASASWNRATTGDNIFHYWQTDAGGTVRGSVDYNRGGSAVRYNTTSDVRLKTKNGPAQYDPNWIGRVAASIFDVTWKETGYRVDTFVAQDLHQAEPDAVRKGDDSPDLEYDEAGKLLSDIWAVDPSKLMAKVILELAAVRREFNAYKAAHP